VSYVFFTTAYQKTNQKDITHKTLSTAAKTTLQFQWSVQSAAKVVLKLHRWKKKLDAAFA